MIILPYIAALLRRALISLCAGMVTALVFMLALESPSVAALGGISAALLAFLFWPSEKPRAKVMARAPARGRTNRSAYPGPIIMKDKETGEAIAPEFDKTARALFDEEPELQQEIAAYWATCHRFLYASKKHALDAEALQLRSRITTQIPLLIDDYLAARGAQTRSENESDLNDTMESIAHITNDADDLRTRILEPVKMRTRLRHKLLRRKDEGEPFE